MTSKQDEGLVNRQTAKGLSIYISQMVTLATQLTDTYPFCGNSILIAPGILVAMVAVEGKVPLGTRLGIPGNMNCTGCAVE